MFRITRALSNKNFDIDNFTKILLQSKSNNIPELIKNTTLNKESYTKIYQNIQSLCEKEKEKKNDYFRHIVIIGLFSLHSDIKPINFISILAMSYSGILSIMAEDKHQELNNILYQLYKYNKNLHN